MLKAPWKKWTVNLTKQKLKNQLQLEFVKTPNKIQNNLEKLLKTKCKIWKQWASKRLNFHLSIPIYKIFIKLYDKIESWWI